MLKYLLQKQADTFSLFLFGGQTPLYALINTGVYERSVPRDMRHGIFMFEAYPSSL